MDAQPAVARSVRREFLRKEKRRELPHLLSGVRRNPDLVRLGVLRSAREKRERTFVAVAHLDREVFGKFPVGTRQTDFQTVHPVCKRQFDAIRHRRFPGAPKACPTPRSPRRSGRPRPHGSAGSPPDGRPRGPDSRPKFCRRPSRSFSVSASTRRSHV
jgi:hypothetical protein